MRNAGLRVVLADDGLAFVRREGVAVVEPVNPADLPVRGLLGRLQRHGRDDP